MSLADSSAARAAVDQNVLLGLLAMQFGCATRAQVAETLADWHQDRTQSFGTILGRRCRFSPQRSTWLSNMVTAVLRPHHNDAGLGLAMLSDLSQLRNELSRIADPDATLHRPASAAVTDTIAVTGPVLADSSSSSQRFQKQQLHATGGMGEVFVAVDRELNRNIALKEIKPQFAQDPLARRRFRRESLITGNLEHPGIVPVYGAGVQADGRPYYAMRLIGGVSLTEKIKAFHRGTRDFSSREFRQLLTQLVTVCNTVAYAHSREILHRDLKPSNVMVGDYGETLLVDWGLARSWREPGEEDEAETAVEAKHFDDSATQQGMAVGTLPYMSPEQATGRVRSFLPAADIYSLGATLYQLLTGRPPYQGSDLQAVFRAVQAGDFRPPRSVCPQTPRALESICLKAMAAQSSARYSSATELAADLESYLADEPVSAYREPLLVRGSRWMKRHRTLVSSAAVAVVLLIATTIGYAAVVANHNHTLTQKNTELAQAKTSLESSNTQLRAATAAATAAQREAERKQKEAEEAQKETADVLAALKGCFRRPDPNYDGEAVTVMQVMKLLENDIRDLFTDRPRIQISLLNTIGQTYRSVGRYPESASRHQQALDLAKKNLPESDELTLDSMLHLGHAIRLLDREDEAIKLYEQVRAIQQAKPGPPDYEAIQTISSLGNVYLAVGRYEDGAAAFEEAYPLMEAMMGETHPETLRIANRVAYAYQLLGRNDEAISMMESVLAKRQERLGREHPDTIISIHDLGVAYISADRPKDALPLLEEGLFLATAAYGKEHPRTIGLMHNVGECYVELKRPAEAIEYLEPAVELMSQKIGGQHPDVYRFRRNLAKAYVASGQSDKGLLLYEDYLRFQQQRLGKDSVRYADISTLICFLELMPFGHFAESEGHLRHSQAVYAKQRGDSWENANGCLQLGRCLWHQMKYSEGESWLLKGQQLMLQFETKAPGEHREMLEIYFEELIEMYTEWGKPAEAVSWKKKLQTWKAQLRK